MNTPDDLKLKAEIDAISKNIDAILEKIESAQPSSQDKTESSEH